MAHRQVALPRAGAQENSVREGSSRKSFDLHQICVVLLALTALSGQFSLVRVSSRFETLGWMGEPRILLMAALIVLSLPLINQFKYREPRLGRKDYSSLFLAIVVIFHFYLIVTYIWSPFGSYSKEQVLSVGLVIVMLCMAYLLAHFDNERTISVFLRTLFLASLIYAVAGLFELSFEPSAGFSFLWGGPNVYVRVVGTGVFVAVYLWMKTSRRIWLISIPVLLLSTMMSGSRGGIASFLIALALSLFLIVKRARKLVVIMAMILILVLVFLYLPITASYRQFIEARYQLTSQDFAGEYQRSRGGIYSRAWQTFSRYPLMGIGIGGFRESEYSYPHNLLLNVAAEGGLLGLFLLGLLLLPLVLRWRQTRKLEHNTCFVLAVFFLAVNMFSGSYYDWRFIWLFLILFMTPSWSETKQTG